MAVSWRRRYIPNQHGAWAMLVIPFLFGMFAGGAVWLHALLFAVWLLSYLFTFPFLQWIKTRKLQHVKAPMLMYGSLFIVLGIVLALSAPQLLRWIPAFIPLFLINCVYARIKRERAFFNDLAAVVLFSMIVFVASDLGQADDWRMAVDLFVFSVLYFTGTIFYVKTIIREKHNKRYYWYSVIYHAALLIAGLLYYPPLTWAPLAVLLVRAVWVPLMNISIKRSGMLEIVWSILITLAVIFA